MKLEFLLDLLLIEYLANGHVAAVIFTIEFQKRDLPHCHLLLILDWNSKLRTPEDIDRCVTAELPDSTTEPHLLEKVSKLIHHPCHNRSRQVCMVNNRCSKKFPKTHTEQTLIDQGTFQKYRKRENGPKILINNIEIGNENVVRYNKFLIAKLNSYINVEVSSTLQAIKYLYKYVYKGHDCTFP